MRSVIAQAILLALWDVHAQTTPTPLTFEVASIKPSAPDVQGVFGPTQSGGSLRIVGATLKNLIAFAHNVREFAISGGPAWVDSDRFDINARAELSSASENSPADPKQMTNAQLRTRDQQMRERLKSLLAERFQLAVHSESKEQNVYALVVAKNGPKFGEAKPETRPMIRGRRGSINGQGVAMQMLVLNLSNSMGRPVLDRTGLTGRYDFKLEWTPDTGQGPGPMAGPPSGAEAPLAPDLKGPSLFAALQEQLGLRLESQKAPVEILVIDHAERPSEN